jgi:voltage-gated potassium channel
MSSEQIRFDQFIAILGWDDFAKNITGQLLASSNNVVVLTEEEDRKPAIEGEFTDQEEESLQVFALHHSDYPGMKEIGLGAARSLFLNLDSDEQNLITILRLQKHFPDLEYMVALTDEELEETFRSAGVTYAVSKFNISSKVLASYLYEPDVAEYTEDLLTATENGEDYDIQQYQVTSQCPAAGESFISVMRTLKSDHRTTPIGLKKQGGELIKIPAPDTVVSEDDHVLLITRGDREGGLENYFGTEEGVLNS